VKTFVLVLSLIVSSSTFASTSRSSEMLLADDGFAAAPNLIDESEVENLILAMNDFLKEDGKYRSDMEPIFRNLRRELTKLKEKGYLRLEFDPRRMSDDDLAALIRKMASYKQVAGPSLLVKTIHTTLVCTSLLTGKCGRLPEVQVPRPSPSISITGTR